MSDEILPDGIPQQSREKSEALLKRAGVISQVCLLGVRGYFLNSMGEQGKNEIGVYDDAIFLISPDIHKAFNANVDPSQETDGVANLMPGLWHFELSIHGKSRPKAQQYECLEQHGPVEVKRFAHGIDKGMFAIQIHRGGYNGTSSLGCQTIFPDQYAEFIESVKSEMRNNDQEIIPYLLLEYEGGLT